ncbi:MAG: TPM domain-containing protein [Verrucomicrobiia bacterium]
MRKFFLLVLFFLSAWMIRAEVIPPSPPHYFNDFASVVSDETIEQLDKKLEQLEKETTAQVVVAIYPKMQTESSIEDYTLRIAEKWRVGQKDKDNGAVLFVFIQDRKMFLQVGYGLEANIPDALAKQIIEYEIKPGFKKGNYDEGLKKGVEAMCRAVSGNYQPQQPSQKGSTDSFKYFLIVPFLFILFVAINIIRTIYQLVTGKAKFFTISSGGSSQSWISGSGWSGSSSGGSGFSGGGGSFGGGGAGGSW